MDIFDNSQPFRDLAPLEKISSDQEQSDSEDEQGLSSLADYDTYEHMNIPDNLKNILRMDSYDMGGTQSDTESDTDSIYKAPSKVNIEQLNVELASKNKFTNFPLMPPSDEPTQPKKKSTKPREKKKKRDKGKKVDILDQAQKSKSRDIKDLYKSFAQDQSEDDDDEEQVKSRKKAGRKTRKQKENNEIKVDENGERLIRTTEFLDADSDSDSNDNHRPLSKKQLLEMQRDANSNRRAADVNLTPVYNVDRIERFLKKGDESESILVGVSSKPKRQSTPPPTTQNDSSDDDLIIVNDPTKLLSPIRPMSHLSPSRPTVAIRYQNKSLLSRITDEAYAYRMKVEKAAKERGQYTSATERAEKLLEKEKNALLIDAQIKMHFERNKSSFNEDDEEEEEEEDEDYKEEEEEEEENYLNQLSGEEEEDIESEGMNKRKMDLEEQESEDEEQDMGIMAMRRWKNKKIRKSIFEDSDDEEEEVVSKKKPAPVPAHSISNFFKAKETKVEEPIEDKPLGRLKRRIIQQDNEEEKEDDDDDAMDLDEPDMTPKTYTPKPKPIPGPKEKNEYFEEEAEEEEDEFFGAGGEDLDNGEDLDEYEEDGLLVHENDEHIDEAALREAFNKQDAESDHNLIQRLLKDVTGGGLRKQKAAQEEGLIMDDIDLYDEEDNDLIAARRIAEARRRKLLKKRGGDILENLMNDPKTSAFAKAAQTVQEVNIFLSDSEGEAEEEEDTERIHTKLVIQEDDDDEEELERPDDFMDMSSDDDLVVDEFNPMASPLRGGFVNTIITSADDENEEFQVETMKTAFSPLNNRRTRSVFSSPKNPNRFKRLISETNGHSTDSSRAAFSMNAPKPNNNNTIEKESTLGSISGFVKNENKPKKSKLSALTKTQNVFKYA